jgi:hypothetical protein
MLRGRILASQRLQLMEIIEKWAMALTGTKPSKFLAASEVIFFTLESDRQSVCQGLRRCLPPDCIQDVVIDGVSWRQ